MKIPNGGKGHDAESFVEKIFDGTREILQIPRKSVKKSRDGLFAKVKVEMVMRIYGVSRASALKIIADREKEIRAAEKEKANRGKNSDGGEDIELLSAAELFGE